MLISFLLLKLIQEYVLGEYDNDATTAYHENSTSEFADDDHHVKDISRRCCTKISWKCREEQHIISGLRLTWMNFCCPCFVADIMSTCTQTGLYVISRTYPGRLRWGQKTNTMNESIIFFYFHVKQFLLQYRSNNFSTFDCSHPSFFQQVRFVCSEPTVLISSIKEISSCKYVVTIQSPMLCKNPYVLIFSS